jgi:hypothetical protein
LHFKPTNGVCSLWKNLNARLYFDYIVGYTAVWGSYQRSIGTADIFRLCEMCPSSLYSMYV